MLPMNGLVLVLALTVAVFVLCEEKQSEFSDAAKDKVQNGLNTAKEGFAKAGEAISQLKDRFGPIASNFSRDFKDRFNDGVKKAQEALTQVKEALSSHVNPFVNKVRTGMLDSVRNLRDKINHKNRTAESGKEETQKDSVKLPG